MELVLRIFVALLSIFLLSITIVSYRKFRRKQTDTMGRTVYLISVVLFTGTAIFIGLVPGMYVFMFCAILAERLIVYRACRRNDYLTRILRKINW